MRASAWLRWPCTEAAPETGGHGGSGQREFWGVGLPAGSCHCGFRVTGLPPLQVTRNTTPMYRTPEIVDLYSNFPIGEKQDIWVRPLGLRKGRRRGLREPRSFLWPPSLFSPVGGAGLSSSWWGRGPQAQCCGWAAQGLGAGRAAGARDLLGPASWSHFWRQAASCCTQAHLPFPSPRGP